MNKTNKIVFALVAVIAIGAGATLSKKHAVPPAAVVPAPAGPVAALYAQSMNDASGAPQALAQWKGKAVLVNFWAPWCGPCVQEMPELVELARELGPKQIGVVGIGIDSPTNIAQFTDKYKISYPIYVAGMSGTELSRQFGNTNGGLPFTVLIGADGTVRKTYLGRLKFAELRADLAAL
ncbi:TlpA family protein disulfide reductase [Massilia sp. DWR3-1-1]|uniref:TlpA family protein disulfide reductase n=1 Tax=Massilia sp. DWR3-1-1 TaxID=2804559 RepID=UPI003CFA4F70